jgi:hypothetical protein
MELVSVKPVMATSKTCTVKGVESYVRRGSGNSREDLLQSRLGSTRWTVSQITSAGPASLELEDSDNLSIQCLSSEATRSSSDSDRAAGLADYNPDSNRQVLIRHVTEGLTTKDIVQVNGYKVKLSYLRGGGPKDVHPNKAFLLQSSSSSNPNTSRPSSRMNNTVYDTRSLLLTKPKLQPKSDIAGSTAGSRLRFCEEENDATTDGDDSKTKNPTTGSNSRATSAMMTPGGARSRSAKTAGGDSQGGWSSNSLPRIQSDNAWSTDATPLDSPTSLIKVS